MSIRKIKLAVVANTHLLPHTEQQIIALLGEPIDFPKEDAQPTTEVLIKRAGNAAIVLVSPGTKITEDFLSACPAIKYIGICGTSKENVDLEAIAKRGITLANVVGYGDEPTAEFIFMQLVCLARGMGKYQWQDRPVELMGKTIGIIGLGTLGKAIARLAIAYKMNVLYYSRNRKTEWEKQGVQYFPKEELLQKSNIVIISTPSNFEALGVGDFSLIQNNSILLQASQGDCFDKGAFLDWIKASDNFAIFDYAAGNHNYERYKDLHGVIFPKIVAGHTQETRQRLGREVVRNLEEYLRSKIEAE